MARPAGAALTDRAGAFQRLRGLITGGGRSTDAERTPAPAAPGKVGQVVLLSVLAGTGLVIALIAILALSGSGDQPAPAPPFETAVPRAIAPPPAAVGSDAGLTIQPFGQPDLSKLPPLPPAEPLPPAPVPALVQKTPAGLLPKIARDGRMPRDVYARPFNRKDDRARVVLVMAGIGLSRTASEAAIEHLPAAVVFAIDAYAPRPEEWARAARQAGHETLVTLPLQEAAFPYDDAGPRALTVEANADQLTKATEALLMQQTGYVGVFASGGGGFGDETVRLSPVLNTLNNRGLLLLDATQGGSGKLVRVPTQKLMPRFAVDVFIDANLSASAVDQQLAILSSRAKERFFAIGLASTPIPLTIERIRRFVASLDEGRYVLAPISAAVTMGDPE